MLEQGFTTNLFESRRAESGRAEGIVRMKNEE